MFIKFNCEHCFQEIDADSSDGHEFTCPACFRLTIVTSNSSNYKTSIENDRNELLPDSIESINQDSLITCPTCWSRFQLDEVLAIACHDALRGDSVLGEMAMLRFLAMEFDRLGRPLDSKGCVCADSACPHCRRKLPSGFFNQKNNIFSIVGEQSSGKSYYLAVLIKTLPAALFNHFDVHFTDADPTGNITLNSMRNALFSAETPSQALLAKTQLTGEMYEEIQLGDWPEALRFPKPFVFTAKKKNNQGNSEKTNGFSLIFYDNAGEHFRPDQDIVKHPGAKHVASASGIIFLFDPFHSPSFRKRMRNDNSKDPQMSKPPTDQQGVLLATMSDRIKAIRGMSIDEKIDSPLAIVVGKCDAWQYFLGDNPWHNPIREKTIDLTAIHYNSDKVRKLLMELSPEIVSGAEAISNNVCYFSTSSFGHTPLMVKEGIVPDPAKLNPIMTEIPPLWLLSQNPSTSTFVPAFVFPQQDATRDTVQRQKPKPARCIVPTKEKNRTSDNPHEYNSVRTVAAHSIAITFDFKTPCTPIVSDLNKLICAYIVADDGCLSESEEKWLEANIGPGGSKEIVKLVGIIDYEELPNQIFRITSRLDSGEQAWLLNAKKLWSQLAQCDGKAEAELQAYKWVCTQVTHGIQVSV